jgi:hypothetical protein
MEEVNVVYQSWMKEMVDLYKGVALQSSAENDELW